MRLPCYHYEKYSLEIHDYNSDNYITGDKNSRRTSTGGDTIMHAIFGQWGWDFAPEWDVALGARFEHWKMEDGFYYRWGGDMEDYRDRTERGFSPKFSLGFTPEGPWKYRYSAARAYRFPIVEELYKNEEATNSTGIADADLDPENGYAPDYWYASSGNGRWLAGGWLSSPWPRSFIRRRG